MVRAAVGRPERAAVAKSGRAAVGRSVWAAGRRVPEQAEAAEPALSTEQMSTIGDCLQTYSGAGEIPLGRSGLGSAVMSGRKSRPEGSASLTPLAPAGLPLPRGGPAPGWQRYLAAAE